MPHTFRQQLQQRTLSLGGWVQIGHPAVAEVFGRAGFDWVCADLEHGAQDLESATGLFRSLSAYPVAPVARIPCNDPLWIRRCLDAGAKGIVVPMITSGAEAEAAVRAAKFPPTGERGFGYMRACEHGVDFQAYIRRANEETAVVVQIEHHRAIDALDDILAVDGVDGALIGPMDLSGSMGICGQLDHPDMRTALDRFLDACRRHGKSAGQHIVHPSVERIQSAKDAGFNLLVLGLDVVFLAEAAAAALREARA
ncbi:MAG TPA: aldolase/citrate lyase family protein [Kiritimatiellia bacterium]|nr:aldolase/citrate lyase family protein [Kiritimatiellia bacterium]